MTEFRRARRILLASVLVAKNVARAKPCRLRSIMSRHDWCCLGDQKTPVPPSPANAGLNGIHLDNPTVVPGPGQLSPCRISKGGRSRVPVTNDGTSARHLTLDFSRARGHAPAVRLSGDSVSNHPIVVDQRDPSERRT